jgi:hypothetical protein
MKGSAGDRMEGSAGEGMKGRLFAQAQAGISRALAMTRSPSSCTLRRLDTFRSGACTRSAQALGHAASGGGLRAGAGLEASSADTRRPAQTRADTPHSHVTRIIYSTYDPLRHAAPGRPGRHDNNIRPFLSVGGRARQGGDWAGSARPSDDSDG